MNNSTNNYTEMYCPVLKKNVIIHSNNNENDCLNDHKCSEKYGSCQNRRMRSK